MSVLTLDLEAYKQWVNEQAQIPGNIVFGHRPYYRHFRVKPQSTILDVGSYVGANLIHYGCFGHRITGVEIALPYYRECIRRLVQAGLPATVYNAAFEEWEPDKFYDHVLCTEMLGHVVDPQVIVDKCYEVLNPGGSAFFTAPIVPPGKVTTWRRIVRTEELGEWARAAGFDVRTFVADGQHICIGDKPDGR